MSERLTEILAAACRVIVRDGAARLRMSDVAREAGVSSALVHYYVATRAELLARAFAYADARADAGVQAELDAGRSALEQLDTLLRFYVGDSPFVRENAVLWREMWVNAMHDDAQRDRLAELYAGWIAQVAGLVAAAQEEGAVDRGIGADGAARRLAALVDGLGAQIAVRMIDGRSASALVRDGIARELGVDRPGVGA